jgi:hypothetical protein
MKNSAPSQSRRWVKGQSHVMAYMYEKVSVSALMGFKAFEKDSLT